MRTRTQVAKEFSLARERAAIGQVAFAAGKLNREIDRRLVRHPECAGVECLRPIIHCRGASDLQTRGRTDEPRTIDAAIARNGCALSETRQAANGQGRAEGKVVVSHTQNVRRGGGALCERRAKAYVAARDPVTECARIGPAVGGQHSGGERCALVHNTAAAGADIVGAAPGGCAAARNHAADRNEIGRLATHLETAVWCDCGALVELEATQCGATVCPKKAIQRDLIAVDNESRRHDRILSSYFVAGEQPISIWCQTERR